jgi:hypothetical protein
MSAGSIVALFDEYRTLAFSSITSSYVAIGTPFAHTVRLLKIINTCDTDMSISFDGVTNNDYIPAGSFSLYDICTNEVTDAGWFFSLGTQVYVKQTSAPSRGGVFVITLYGQGE